MYILAGARVWREQPMKEVRPPYTIVVNGTTRYYCTPCGRHREKESFYACALAKMARRCKRHWLRDAQKQRMASPLGRMLLSIRTRLRAQGERELARAWEISDVEAVLRRFGHCPPYGAGERLCIVCNDKSRPLRPENARPMLSRKARGRHHRQAVRGDGGARRQEVRTPTQLGGEHPSDGRRLQRQRPPLRRQALAMAVAADPEELANRPAAASGHE